jgi:arsenate reductase (thioredoxin)
VTATLRPARPRTVPPLPLVVFLGTAGDAVARLAAALLARRSRGLVRVVSMSSAAAELDPVVVRVAKEAGADLVRCHSLPPSDELLRRADLVVVIGYDGDAVVPATVACEDWYIDDPRGKDVVTTRHLRDAIDLRVRRLLARLERDGLLPAVLPETGHATPA